MVRPPIEKEERAELHHTNWIERIDLLVIINSSNRWASRGTSPRHRQNKEEGPRSMRSRKSAPGTGIIPEAHQDYPRARSRSAQGQ